MDAKLSLCDYEPLQRCLKENSGDRSKCLKEWNEFQQACQKRKKNEMVSKGQTDTPTECEACKN